MKINLPQPSSLTLKAQINLFFCAQGSKGAHSVNFGPCDKHKMHLHEVSKGAPSTLIVIPFSVRTGAGSYRLGSCVFISLLLFLDPTLHTKCSSRLAGGTRTFSSYSFLFSIMCLEPLGGKNNQPNKNKQQKSPQRERGCFSMIYKDGSIYTNGRNWHMLLLGGCWSNPRDQYWPLVRHRTVPMDLNRQEWFSCFNFLGWEKTSGKKVFFHLLCCVTQKSSLVLLPHFPLRQSN